MRMIEANGVGLHVRDEGDPAGAPLVFANSLGTDLRLWDAILPRLPAGLRIIRHDTRGHGLSDCPEAPYAMDDLVTDAEALLDALDVTGCVFVGLSLGGMIGQGLAARRPDLVRALVLSNTAARMGDPAMWHARIASIRAGALEAVADGVLDRWFGPAFRARPEAAAWRNMMTRTPREGYIGCAEAIAAADLSEPSAGLSLPVLGIAGSEDGASPPELVAGTVTRIPGARLEIIDQAGHLPCVERPEIYAGLLTDFLEEIRHV
ncbi:3-oxoadipate enol-lactonase [Tropicimonas sp. IMCC6043]|uniref:3-oxoadipate enol-lactonase n=1 Tax=Tropicimonas sp. IMCC6043 TaxID=2510645 RepID=UPI00101CC00D|nr:3-oxoadipate enol-lactonase [Tropicimonas sp. IMCC6043]RYH12210.1 3-oxoadipate enol-lactonase [Tropicimonas sp. IMCC6043]